LSKLSPELRIANCELRIANPIANPELPNCPRNSGIPEFPIPRTEFTVPGIHLFPQTKTRLFTGISKSPTNDISHPSANATRSSKFLTPLAGSRRFNH